jgi:AraC-like DNA-binding protein
MEKYAIESTELDNVMKILYRVFDVRITFFDLQEHEIDDFQIKEMSAYCKNRRKDADFESKCIECDTANLILAKKKRNVHIYTCHEGLLEGIVPLYNDNENYLGAIVYGQLKEKGSPIPGNLPPLFKSLFKELPECDRIRFKDIGILLKYLSEYIIRNELIKYQNQPWAQKLEKYINSHLAQKITLEKLGKVINRSPTFITHQFQTEFGLSPKKYIIKKKMLKAREMLENGESVANTASSLGFYDEFHFSKSFKTYWGQSPKNFKQQ